MLRYRTYWNIFLLSWPGKAINTLTHCAVIIDGACR